MAILIEQGSHHLRNVGDVAMLQVALQRLGDLWPDWPLLVLNKAPERLATLCPQATHVPAAGRSGLTPCSDASISIYLLHEKAVG